MQAENISVILENSAGPCYLRIFFGFWNILVNLFSWWKIRKLSLLMWLLHRFPKVYLSHSLPHIRFSPPFFHCMAVRSGQYCSNHWEHLLLPFSPSGLKFFLHIGEKKKKIQRPGSFTGGNQAKLPPPQWTTRPFENWWLFLFVST